MGGEWYWGGVKSSSISTKKVRERANRQSSSDATPAGCMNAVLHLLDFHHFQFGIRMPPQHQEPSLLSPVNGFASPSSSSSSPPLPEELAPPKGIDWLIRATPFSCYPFGKKFW